MHDFCFLMQTQKELVGMAKSTYLFWASILGNVQHVRLYSIDSDATRKKVSDRGKGRVFFHYNWTHPELKRRIHYELYRQQEEQ